MRLEERARCARPSLAPPLTPPFSSLITHLRERLRVAEHARDVADLGARQREQAVLDRDARLADDVQPVAQQQVVHYVMGCVWVCVVLRGVGGCVGVRVGVGVGVGAGVCRGGRRARGKFGAGAARGGRGEQGR